MIRYIFLLSISILSLTGYSQQLQVFSAGGSSVNSGGNNLQGTIGESVMFSAGSTNFTQGFNQPLVNPICAELAKLINNTAEVSLCLDQSFTVELANSYTATGDKMEWYLASNPTASIGSGTSYEYSSTVAKAPDSLFAIVKEGFCSDTSAKTPFIVLDDNSNTIVFETGTTALCDGNVVLKLSIASSEIQWLLDGDKIEGATEDEYSVLVGGIYSVSIPEATCGSNVSEKEINSDLTSFMINDLGTQFSSSETGDHYQWYIELGARTYSIVGANSKKYTPLYNGAYKVEVRRASCQGVSDTEDYTSAQYDAQRFAHFLDGDQVVLEETANQLSVYPNPNQGVFTLSYLGNSNELMSVKIYNAVGQLVFMNKFASANEVPVQVNQPTGLYILVVEVNGEVFKEKLVID
jgi:hypothetical protein